MAESSALSTMERILLLLIVTFTFVSTIEISNKRRCADKECKVVISKAIALAGHGGDHPLLLVFEKGDMIHITSKSAGKNPLLWGGEVNGQKGYFNKNFVKEIKVNVQNPLHEVDTEGDIFEKLGKIPPSMSNKKRVDEDELVDEHNQDVAEGSNKADAAVSDNVISDGKKDDEGEKLKIAEVTKQEEEVDDLLSMAATEDKSKKSETDLNEAYDVADDNHSETDLSEAHDVADDNQNDDEPEKNGEDLDEDIWDIDDDDYYFEQERDRFDTADLNNFLRKNLWDGETVSKDDTPAKSEQEDKASLIVEPEVSKKSEDSQGVKEPSVVREKLVDEGITKYNVDNNDEKGKLSEDDIKKNIEDAGKKNKDVNDDDEDEEKRQSNDKEEKTSNGRQNAPEDDNDFDPTEINESSHSESEDVDKSAEEGKDPLETGKSEISESDDESNQTSEEETLSDRSKDVRAEKANTGGKEDVEKSSRKDLEGGDVSEKRVEKESQDSNESKVSSKEVDVKRTEAGEEEKDVENKTIDDGKPNAGEEKEDLAASLVDVENADKGDTQEETSPDSQRTIDSQVRPDTPSDTLSPESAQGEDPVASEKGTFNDVETQLQASVETGADKEVDTSKSDDRSPKESFKQTSELDDSGVGEEDGKAIGHGFDSFIESSRVEPQESGTATETPKLTTNPTTAFLEGEVSKSHFQTANIDSSQADDHGAVTTEDDGDNKLPEGEGAETIIEEGSTIIIDRNGDLVTAILPEAHVSVQSQSSSPSLNSQQVNPTAIRKILEPPESPGMKEEQSSSDSGNEHAQSHRNNVSLSGTQTSNSQPEIDDLSADRNLISEAYQNSEFNSRKVLSVKQPQSASQKQLQQSPPTTEKQQLPSEEKKQQHITVEPTSIQEHHLTSDTELRSKVSDINTEAAAESVEVVDASKSSVSSEGQPVTAQSEEKIRDNVPNSDQKPDEPAGDREPEGTTVSSEDNGEIPSPINSLGSQSLPESSDKTSEDYEADSAYHSRKITDENLFAAEEQEFADASQGFFKKVFTAIEKQTKDLAEKIPPSVQAVLEPFGLSPNFKVLVITFSLAMLISASLISCCFSGGSNKKQQKELLIKFDELERKRLIDVKEKQNLEDEIAIETEKNAQMRGEVSKLKENLQKSKSEQHTIQLHNETLKKQLAALEGEIEELKDNASTKQGEVKQQSKKTKDLEKQLKKLQEKEKSLEQTMQKVTSDLKHKEEEVVLLTSRVAGLTDQVGHLQISKDQLLAEAEDWKEKVVDLKDRLGQREEEFRQMQENIMFKENELEVLKDCFLQLKAFEEPEQEEAAEDVSARVQEKIASMIDVSKMNASLLALEEEKNNLANKLEIELEARRELEEQLESSRRSVETSMTDKMKAERQCQEAQTKLNVLSSYFKEKELQLQRELGEQEALKKQNQNKLLSADEVTRSVQQELDFIRTQNESFKRELASSERDFRSQIAANEKKAHENWLAARAAERELKEARHEAGVLRQKLIDLERRQFMGPGGLIRPLPTRGMPPSGVMNGPPPPGMERSPSRGDLPPLPLPHLRDDDFLPPSRDRGPPFPIDPRRGPVLPPGMRPPHPDARSPPLRMPPFSDARSPPPRLPPPGMLDGRSPPPYDRRPPPAHMLDRRSPPFRLPPPDMLPPAMRDGRYPLPPFSRNPPPPSDRPPKQSSHTPPHQQQSQV